MKIKFIEFTFSKVSRHIDIALPDIEFQKNFTYIAADMEKVLEHIRALIPTSQKDNTVSIKGYLSFKANNPIMKIKLKGLSLPKTIQPQLDSYLKDI